MGRPSNREKRRAQIVEALGRLIPTQGFRGTSIKDIANEAELGSGLVHYHFKTKLEIFLSLIEHLNLVVSKRYEARCESDDPKERLRAFIDALLALGGDADVQAVACWVAIGAESLSDDEVAAAYQKVMKDRARELRKIIKGFPVASKLSSSELSSLVGTITALIEGYFHVAATTPQLIPKGSAAKAVFDVAMGLIQTKRK